MHFLFVYAFEFSSSSSPYLAQELFRFRLGSHFLSFCGVVLSGSVSIVSIFKIVHEKNKNFIGDCAKR